MFGTQDKLHVKLLVASSNVLKCLREKYRYF